MKNVLIEFSNILSDCGVNNALIEIQRFLSDVFNIPLSRIIAGDFEFTEEMENRLKDFVSRRALGVPYSYITGFAYFYGLRFAVNQHVLIPRPETEILVEYILKRELSDFKGTVLDCCTGCGNIAISLGLQMKEASIIATDISKFAVLTGYKNSAYHSAKNVFFMVADKLEAFKPESFDIIVANPPYIGFKEENILEKEVLNEPYSALFGGEEGFEFTYDLLVQAKKVLKKDGYMVFEMGYNQKEIIEGIIKSLFPGNSYFFLKDLNGHYRAGVIEGA